MEVFAHSGYRRASMDQVAEAAGLTRQAVYHYFKSKEQLYVPGGRFDYLKFWANDPRFEPFWAGYEHRASKNGFAVYTAR